MATDRRRNPVHVVLSAAMGRLATMSRSGIVPAQAPPLS
jgi:hypothetical protein